MKRHRQRSVFGTVAALWGVTGVCLILGFAIFRLSKVIVDAFRFPFAWYHWVGLVAYSAFMAISEGYIGFQKQFSPRVAARAKYLKEHPRNGWALLAPFFCIGYFHIVARRRRVILALNVAIVFLIILVRKLPQPWRGIVDAGVVVGLIWGVLVLLVFSYQALFGTGFQHSPEVPTV